MSASWSWQKKDTSDFSLLLFGDTTIQHRDQPVSAFTNVQATLSAADLVIGQAEGLFCECSHDPQNPDILHKPHWRHSDPAMVYGFVQAGIAAVSCASNVSFPRKLVTQCIANLEKAGLPFAGIGRNIAEARRPAILNKKGYRVGLLSYTSIFWPFGHEATETEAGVATIKALTSYQPHRRVHEMPGGPATVITTPVPEALAAMENDIRQLRTQVDVVIVSCHWGVSGSYEIAEYQRTVGRAAINAGADVVYGHHPHKIQEIEIWQDRPIFYSLGNFAFDWVEARNRDREGLLARLLFSKGKLIGVSAAPAQRNIDNLITLYSPQTEIGRSIILPCLERSALNGTRVEIVDNEIRVNLE